MEDIEIKILNAISETTRIKEELREKHNKFNITLTTALRLLDRPADSVLEGLGGQPEQIKAYVIRQALELANEVADVVLKIQTMLERLHEEIRKQ